MGLLDKAKDLLGQHDDKVDQGLDKAGEHAKGRFAGHEDKIDGIVDQAQQRTGAGDTTAAPPEPGPHADAPPAQEPHADAPPAQEQTPPQQ